MHLLIIGTLDGQIGAASQIAMSRGATVAQSDDIQGGLRALRSGQGADLVMIDVQLDVGALVRGLQTERIAARPELSGPVLIIIGEVVAAGAIGAVPAALSELAA